MRIYRHYNQVLKPLPLQALAVLTALRTLSLGSRILFVEAIGGYEHLERTLPPDLETLLPYAYDDKIFWIQLQHVVQSVLDAKQWLVPGLRRLKLISESRRDLDKLDMKSRDTAKLRGVELVFTMSFDFVDLWSGHDWLVREA